MTTRRKWVLGSVACVLVVLAVAAYQFETQYEMGKVAFPWQTARRRLIAERRMFGGMSGSRFVKFKIDDDADEREARERSNRVACEKLGAAMTGYFVRCSEAKEPDLASVRADWQDQVTHALPKVVTVCSETQASNIGPPEEEFDSCVAFFTSGTCDVLDYGENELALGTLDMMVKKPTRPQPHLVACPFLFGN